MQQERAENSLHTAAAKLRETAQDVSDRGRGFLLLQSSRGSARTTMGATIENVNKCQYACDYAQACPPNSENLRHS